MSVSKICAVVGVGPGLGKSVAVKFASQGFAVAVMSRKKASCESTLEKIKEIGGKGVYVPIDVSDEKQVQGAFDEVRKSLGNPTVMVYNAGNAVMGGILELDLAKFKKTWEVGCYGALLCARQVLPAMVEAKEGTILVSSATAAFRAGKNWAPFCVSKFGLRALSQSISKEFAPQGIHVCHIRLDCALSGSSYTKNMPKEKVGNVDEIAETYYMMHCQPKYGWTNEIDIRPHGENWTC
mmetsp:Transcript_24301/g.43099  ORF Transcript_24301/g.43099 Transcript_24301/m.43099 type:complete len:238 (-) Transcript_24301:192-905(-)|eukprot:CAMPEP_0197516212 /NCGR_PEP_ID=MMETSP1318-20131121/1058_1 /TAXON_ID=552666 /ORGANISM="Partenskyella glossopodia, Strain RCC365" /LENGTH=237 /DNA_ID=CAMNT_0043064751 /DNA_START=82 /DNA_END=795 /DNA_ORIENTATION=+